MAQGTPIWQAAELNELMRRVGDASLGFAPSGDIIRIDTAVWHLVVPPADAADSPKGKPSSRADLVCQNVVGIETATTNLGRLPLLVSLYAFDPEAWCIVIIHPGAFEAVGPFRDVASPLREWLLRATHAGHSIGRYPAGSIEPALKSIIPIRRGGSAAVAPTSPLSVISDKLVSTRTSLPELVPCEKRRSAAWIVDHLQAFEAKSPPSPVDLDPDRIAVAAGLWQMNAFLDRSHELSQSIEGKGRNRAGDYWHAIMHRREPDYSNAKYWFRRVGQHGIHPFLARDAGDILAACRSADAPRWRNELVEKGRERWNSIAFVDLCEHVVDGHDSELSLAARQIQLIEMVLLLSSTYHDAVG
jgi:hypothetical protein